MEGSLPLVAYIEEIQQVLGELFSLTFHLVVHGEQLSVRRMSILDFKMNI